MVNRRRFRLLVEQKLEEGDKKTAAALRRIIEDQGKSDEDRILALEVYLGPISPDSELRSKVRTIKRCLEDKSLALQFTAACIVADGWINPNKSILDRLREMHDHPASNTRSAVHEALKEYDN